MRGEHFECERFSEVHRPPPRPKIMTTPLDDDYENGFPSWRMLWLRVSISHHHKIFFILYILRECTSLPYWHSMNIVMQAEQYILHNPMNMAWFIWLSNKSAAERQRSGPAKHRSFPKTWRKAKLNVRLRHLSLLPSPWFLQVREIAVISQSWSITKRYLLFIFFSHFTGRWKCLEIHNNYLYLLVPNTQ